RETENITPDVLINEANATANFEEIKDNQNQSPEKSDMPNISISCKSKPATVDEISTSSSQRVPPIQDYSKVFPVEDYPISAFTIQHSTPVKDSAEIRSVENQNYMEDDLAASDKNNACDTAAESVEI